MAWAIYGFALSHGEASDPAEQRPRNLGIAGDTPGLTGKVKNRFLSACRWIVVIPQSQLNEP
jgi:hypothetical protein